jgi:hypothetical protein
LSTILALLTASILGILRKPDASSVELREALARLDPSAAERAVEALEMERQRLLLQDGVDKQLDAIEAKITAGNREVERQFAAKAELERQIKAAEEREQAADIEKRAADARKTAKAMMRSYVELDGLARQMVEILRTIKAGEEEIRLANAFTLEHGRRDLKVESVMGLLAEHVGVPIHNLPMVHTWSLHGYWPDAGAVSTAAGLVNPGHCALPEARRLRRMQELLKA